MGTTAEDARQHGGAPFVPSHVDYGAIWHPIDSAPKDGTPLLTWNGKVMYVSWWDGIGWAFLKDSHNRTYSHFPSHWMLLPVPPEH